MSHVRSLALLLSASLLLALPAAAQFPAGDKDVTLSANETYVVLAPALTPATLIPFRVAVEGRGDDCFDVTVENAGATVSLLLPDGTEVNGLNAASLGFGYGVIASDSEEVTSGLLISPFSLSGTHTLINLPSTAPPGLYQIKVNTSGVTEPTAVHAVYLSGSGIRAALVTDAETYTTGGTVVLSAFLFDDGTPMPDASFETFVADQDDPEAPPVQVTMLDSGPHDAAPGDGIYTGVYTAAAAGKFIASTRASGVTANGVAYARTTGTGFRVLPLLAAFSSFSDAALDDNGNGLIDRVAVTAALDVQRAGNYRLELSLAASNGREERAFASASLATGAQQLSASFPAAQIRRLGVDGPYTIKGAQLLYLDDPEEPLAASRENGGPTAAYALSALERPALKFTGNNTVTRLDTNGNGKFELLRIQAEVNALTPGAYEWSGTLRDAAGREIEAFDGSSSLAAGNNVITFDFDGAKIARNGADGPYALRSVLVYNAEAAVDVAELLRTPAFPVSEFECAGMMALPVQSVVLTPASVVGGNATTLRVTLAEPAGGCGTRVVVGSDNPSLILAAFPSDLVIPAGQSFADVTIIPSVVTSASQVNLKATSGASSQSAALNILPGSLAAVRLPVHVKAGESATGAVVLDGPAPSGGMPVSLSSGNVGVATVTASVTVRAGKREAAFSIYTNATAPGVTAVSVTASAAATTKTATFNVFNEVYLNGAITPGGQPVTVNATQPGQNFLLPFDGAAGQRVSLRVTNVALTPSGGGARVSIKKPDGSYLVSPVWVNGSGAYIDAVTLPAAGSYTVVLDPDGDSVGGMTVTLYDVPPDVSAAITPGGAPVSASTTTPGQNVRMTFAGVANRRVSLKAAPGSVTSGYVSLLRPDGTPLLGPAYVSASGLFVDATLLPASGTYTILFDPSTYNTGGVTVTLYDVPDDVAGSITPGGAPLTVTMGTPGQNAQVSFEGTANQRVSLNIAAALSGSNGYADITLLRPDGTTLASATNVNSSGRFINTLTLPVNGSYRIAVNPQSFNTGNVTLTLNDVSADVTGAVAVGGPSVTVTTTVAGQNARVTFDGVAGQRVSLGVASTMSSCAVTIYNPDGTTLNSGSAGTGGGFLDARTLPLSGSYTIVIDPSSTHTGSVTLTLYNVVDVVGPITPGGAPVTTQVTTPGQNVALTFDGAAGQRVSLGLTGNTFGFVAYSNINVVVKDPGGAVLGTAGVNTTGAVFLDAMTLPVAGTYTISLDPPSSRTGGMTFTLYDVPADATGSITADGPATTLTTTVPGQNLLLTFDGAANQKVSLLTSASGMGVPNMTIFNPDGTELGGAREGLTLPATGTYKVFANPSGTSTGSLTFTLYNVGDSTGVIAIDGPSVTANITTPGQQASLTFNGAAGQRVSLNITGGTFPFVAYTNVYVHVRKPDGTTLATADINGSSTKFVEVFTLPVTGAYTISLDPPSTRTGSATFNLYNVVDVTGTTAVGGPPVTKTTTVMGQNVLLAFDGAAGQKISLASTGLGGVSVLSPDGATVGSGSSMDARTLPVTGTYTVFVNPSGPTTGSVTVTLYNVVDIAGTITPDGSPVTATFNTPGQRATYTFAGTAGQRVSLNIASGFPFVAYTNVYVYVRKPDGTALATADINGGNRFVDTITLPVTGTYVVDCDPPGMRTGGATFYLYDVADVAGTVSVGGAAVPVSVTTPGQNAALTFAGVAGQQVTVRLTGNTMSTVAVKLVKPDGAVMTSKSSSVAAFNLTTQTLPADGTYTIVLDPSGANTGAASVSLTSP